MSDRRRLFVALLIGFGCLAGCASTPGGRGASPVRVVSTRSALGEGVVFVDTTTLRLPRGDRGQMNRAARDYARGVGADVALVRVTDDTGPELLFTVEAYRRIAGGN